jgi:hypothetical protein
MWFLCVATSCSLVRGTDVSEKPTTFGFRLDTKKGFHCVVFTVNFY